MDGLSYHGDVTYWGLVEYISRPARHALVLTVLGEIEKALEENSNMGTIRKKRGRPPTPNTVLATEANVSKMTVCRWVNGGAQSCDANAEVLIKLAEKYAPEKLRELLKDDLLRHGRELRIYLKDLDNRVTPPSYDKK